MLLAEIREASAPPAIAELYGDIRAVLGVPMVNLIYRHIATIPNGLAWAWSALRSHIISSELEPLVETLLRDTADAPWPGRSPLGRLPVARGAEIATVVDWYNRGNAINLITLLALKNAIVAVSQDDLPPAPARTVLTEALPAPVPLVDLDGALRERVRATAQRQGLLATGVTPTMYLHLARWPEVLAEVLDYVDRAIAEGCLAESVDQLLAAVSAPASELASRLASRAPAPSEADRLRLNAALEQFTTVTIPQMLAVGAHLRNCGGPSTSSG